MLRIRGKYFLLQGWLSSSLPIPLNTPLSGLFISISYNKPIYLPQNSSFPQFEKILSIGLISKGHVLDDEEENARLVQNEKRAFRRGKNQEEDK